MKTLVTGGNGFVGSALVRKLLAREEDVRITIRHQSTTVNIDDLDVERVYADIRDSEAVRKATTFSLLVRRRQHASRATVRHDGLPRLERRTAATRSTRPGRDGSRQSGPRR